MGSTNIIFNNCKVCNKPIDDSFYDKSVYRPICSRSCYSKYIDSLPARYEKKRFEAPLNQEKEIIREYHMKGHLVINYNLSRMW